MRENRSNQNERFRKKSDAVILKSPIESFILYT